MIKSKEDLKYYLEEDKKVLGIKMRKPCITMRDSTEWVELVDSGWNTLVGANTDKIVETLCNAKSPSELPLLYGDGNCAEKICKEIL